MLHLCAVHADRLSIVLQIGTGAVRCKHAGVGVHRSAAAFECSTAAAGPAQHGMHPGAGPGPGPLGRYMAQGQGRAQEPCTQG